MPRTLIHPLPVVAASLLTWFALPASADDINPIDGLWVIDQENDGNPGRGFQLALQNYTLVLTFYGYEADGSANWWLAAGVFQPGASTVTMNLDTYQGGMAFGDPLQNATLIGSDGQVTIRFFSSSSGEICLPAETCKAISHLNFGLDSNADQRSLDGNWQTPEGGLLVLDNGRYINFETTACDITGIENGSYTYNSSTRRITQLSVLRDDNGECGLAENGIPAVDYQVWVERNTLIVEGVDENGAFCEVLSPIF